MIDFCETHNIENLIKVPMCFKNPINPSSIEYLQIEKIAFKIGERDRSEWSSQDDINCLQNIF